MFSTQKIIEYVLCIASKNNCIDFDYSFKLLLAVVLFLFWTSNPGSYVCVCVFFSYAIAKSIQTELKNQVDAITARITWSSLGNKVTYHDNLSTETNHIHHCIQRHSVDVFLHVVTGCYVDYALFQVVGLGDSSCTSCNRHISQLDFPVEKTRFGNNRFFLK